MRVDEMLVGVLCIGLIGMWMEWMFGLVEHRLNIPMGGDGSSAHPCSNWKASARSMIPDMP